MVVSRNFHEAS
jgi:hypothetical protein